MRLAYPRCPICGGRHWRPGLPRWSALISAALLLTFQPSQGQAATLEQPTTEPGATVCATVSPLAGRYSVDATATDTDGNESARSNQIEKQLPGEICWRNPTENIDGTALDDLELVTLYYELLEADPGEPTVIALSVDCAAAVACLAVEVVAGITGQPINLTWPATTPPYEVTVSEWPDDDPVALGTLQGESFEWTPTRAGAYSLTVQDSSGDSTPVEHVFVIKLAAPTSGGIE